MWERNQDGRGHLERWVRAGSCVICLALASAAPLALSATSSAQPPVLVDADGTVHMPAQSVPVSNFLSPEGQAYLAEHLQQVQRPEMVVQNNGVPPLLEGYLSRQRSLFAVDRRDIHIAGVHAYEYLPKNGVTRRNQNRVLIDLHGGGFSGCWPGCAELESIPIASLGRIRIVSLDYREGPDFKFPAASEDVAAVYRELLKSHRARDIGIYGCSAGGMLTAMSVAWFQRHDLPRPGAVGILCAGAASITGPGFGGDANYTALPLGEGRMSLGAPATTASEPAKRPGLAYLADTDPSDPLVGPASSSEVLAKFPPTLIVTGTRAFELSAAVYTHSQMVKLGVDAQLHVWEGMFHGFFYNPDVPESRDCYDVIVKFFDRELGKPPAGG
jgi:monoterpene epsilon-lactone hydrolase